MEHRGKRAQEAITYRIDNDACKRHTTDLEYVKSNSCVTIERITNQTKDCPQIGWPLLPTLKLPLEIQSPVKAPK